MSNDSGSTRQLYDRTAAGWVRQAPSSVSDFTARPSVLEMCRPFYGLRVLDLGCGEGYCARILRQGGALEVIGIDLSGGMIAAARAEEERQPLGIAYAQADATDLSKQPSGSIDLVLAMFLFNYLTSDATRACMTEVARVLAPGGRFVFAVPHPALPWLRKASPPFYFEVDSRGYFEARNTRFAGKIWKRDGTQLDVQLVHKTLEDYFGALQAAGFATMPTVRELRVTEEILRIDPEFFGPLVDVPLHLAVAIER
jgi:ubiquinone/menaquinone biosynthesis C-methylase UbiE